MYVPYRSRCFGIRTIGKFKMAQVYGGAGLSSIAFIRLPSRRKGWHDVFSGHFNISVSMRHDDEDIVNELF